jgi:hypothetical protein
MQKQDSAHEDPVANLQAPPIYSDTSKSTLEHHNEKPLIHHETHKAFYRLWIWLAQGSGAPRAAEGWNHEDPTARMGNHYLTTRTRDKEYQT